MKSNQILAVIAVVLLVLSVWVYHAGISRAERFERGQSFLPNLNPDEIDTIEISKGDERSVLKRDDEQFLLTTANGYPAKNEAVNRLIRNVLEINLEKQVGSSDSLLEELELVPGKESTTEVLLKNAAGKEMVHFLVGKAAEGGAGSFVRRLDSDEPAAYLTSKNVYLTTGDKSYLKKEILDVKGNEVAAIRGRDLEITDVDGQLTLQGVPSGKSEKTSEMSSIKGVLSSLSFDEVFLGDDPEVAGLRFQQYLQVSLKDKSGYNLALAEKGGDTYLQISGYHEVNRMEVGQEEGEEQLKEKAEVLNRLNEIQQFNDFHGSWVYKLSSATADKIKLTKNDLIESKS